MYHVRDGHPTVILVFVVYLLPDICVCVCVFFALYRSSRRHPAHPVSALILQPEIQALLWSQNYDTAVSCIRYTVYDDTNSLVCKVPGNTCYYVRRPYAIVHVNARMVRQRYRLRQPHTQPCPRAVTRTASTQHIYVESMCRVYCLGIISLFLHIQRHQYTQCPDSSSYATGATNDVAYCCTLVRQRKKISANE